MSNEKQQTIIQVLINGLIVRKENIIKNGDSMPHYMLEGGVMAFESAIDLAQSLLQKEKEQIKDAFINGFCNAHNLEDKSINADEIFYRTRYGGNK
jgi:hypothetical protein